MVDLVPPRDENKVWHPEPLMILRHQIEIYGVLKDGKETIRRLKMGTDEHWYLFDRTGRAVARFSPQEWAKGLAGL